MEQPLIVRQQKAIFSRDLPITGHEIFYVEANENEAINAYFRKNTEAIKNIFGESFFYLPAIIDKLEPIIEYNWPDVETERIKRIKPDSQNIQEIYRDILSYRIEETKQAEELPIEFTETPMLVRNEYLTLEGHLITLFPLRYSNDEQFQQLLRAISKVPRPDSGIRHSTIIETAPMQDPRDRADWESINTLTKEIQERIDQLRLMGLNDYVIRKLVNLPEPKLSRLRITPEYRIFLPDYNNKEIVMPTLSKVVYFFFLRHPNGMRFKEMIDYRNELIQLYCRISSRGDLVKMEQSIDELVDSTRNSINEKCSRIRAAFVSQFNNELAKNYCITYGNGNVKLIKLERGLVIDEANITNNNDGCQW